MNRGDIVNVRDFRDRLHRRIVWEELGTSIVVCTESDYEGWKRTGLEPKVVGFPIEDVKLLEKKVIRAEI